MGGPWRAEWRTAGDWVPVAAVALVSQSALGLEQPWAGSDLALALTSLALSLPLALRRRHPLAADVLLAGALVLQMGLGGSLHFGSFVAVLVAAYATGRSCRTWPRAVAGGATLLAGALGATFRSALEHPDEALFPLFYVSAALGLGRVVRRLAAQAEDLRRANAALARERDTAARLAVATERVRLARELHDVVAHLLTVTVVQAEAGEDSLARDPAAARRALQRIQESGRDGLRELRGMVRVLRSEDDPATPRLEDLDTLAAVLSEAGLAVRVRRGPGLPEVDAELGGQLYRVVQEALTNIVKHSAATAATVHLERHGSQLRLEVSDPGPSLATDSGPRPGGSGSGSGSGGHGLTGMAERMAPFGGRVEAGRRADGYSVLVSVPLSAVVPGPAGADRPADGIPGR